MSWWHKKPFPGGHDIAGDPQVSPYADSDTDETSARKPNLPAVPVPAEPETVFTDERQIQAAGDTREADRRSAKGASNTTCLGQDNRGSRQTLSAEILAEVRRDAAIQDQLDETSGFSVGEVLLIRGVFWRIHALTEKRMYLDHLGGRGEVFK